MSTRAALVRRLRRDRVALQPGAMELLEEALSVEEDPDAAVERVVGALRKRMQDATVERGSGKGARGAGAGAAAAAAAAAAGLVDAATMASVLEELRKDTADVRAEAIQVLNAFATPQLRWNPQTRAFLPVADRSLHPSAAQRATMDRDRLDMIQQRTMRDPRFARSGGVGAASAASLSSHGVSHDKQPITLTPIEALITGAPGTGPNGGHHILGLLTTIEDGRYYLEDATARVPLDLTNITQRGLGFFTEGSVVLCIGVFVSAEDAGDEEEEEEEGVEAGGDVEMAAGRFAPAASASTRPGASASASRRKPATGLGPQAYFRVDCILHPPSEDRRATDAALAGASRLFLGLPPLSRHESERLRAFETSATDEYFVMLSDVHLDEADTVANLATVLGGYEEAPPALMVLMGDFASKPFGFDRRSPEQCSPDMYGALFEELGALIARHPTLVAKTHFLIVPGPHDPSTGAAVVLPKPPIPEAFAARLRSRLPAHARVTFSTNPCRVLFYLQEIVLFRENLIGKLRRHCVVMRAQQQRQRGRGGGARGDADADDGDAAAAQLHKTDKDVTQFVAKTIIDQAHLCPLPFASRPTYCAYDAALRLFPVPDVIVLADHYDQFEHSYKGCVTFNPGGFSTDSSFVVYRPAERRREFCRVTAAVQKAAAEAVAASASKRASSSLSRTKAKAAAAAASAATTTSPVKRRLDLSSGDGGEGDAEEIGMAEEVAAEDAAEPVGGGETVATDEQGMEDAQGHEDEGNDVDADAEVDDEVDMSPAPEDDADDVFASPSRPRRGGPQPSRRDVDVEGNEEDEDAMLEHLTLKRHASPTATPSGERQPHEDAGSPNPAESSSSSPTPSHQAMEMDS